MKRRTFAGWAAAAAWLGASRSMAAGYPERAVRVVVAWPGGGLVDIPARLAAEHLQKTMGQPFVVDNKPGAGGNLGADVVAPSTVRWACPCHSTCSRTSSPWPPWRMRR